MKVLFDINHPAHVHVFRNVIQHLVAAGHEVMVTSRDKECATELLDFTKINHRVLSSAGSNKNGSFLKELLLKDWRLFKAARAFNADIMVSVAGTFIAHVSLFTGIPSLVLYDTEDAKLQNMITYPFLTKLCVPECYTGWTPRKKTMRYCGYHELAYLSPEYFEVNEALALKNGVKEGKNIFIRLVSWDANHDVGYAGWSEKSLDELINYFSESSNIIISSERLLPEKYNHLRYQGKIGEIHHVMASCDLFIGESATMASESAVLGIPAIYVSDAFRGYMNDIELRYSLVKVITDFDFREIKIAADGFLSDDKSHFKQQRDQLLEDCVDVTELIYSQILELGKSE